MLTQIEDEARELLQKEAVAQEMYIQARAALLTDQAETEAKQMLVVHKQPRPHPLY